MLHPHEVDYPTRSYRATTDGCRTPSFAILDIGPVWDFDDCKCRVAELLDRLGSIGPSPMFHQNLNADTCLVDVVSESAVTLLQELIEERFAALAEQWRAKTAHLSSITDIAMHPAYQRIIGMGPDAVPLILRELSKEPDHWFWALVAITGENPVRPEDAGDLDKMAKAWIQLGRDRGWI